MKASQTVRLAVDHKRWIGVSDHSRLDRLLENDGEGTQEQGDETVKGTFNVTTMPI